MKKLLSILLVLLLAVSLLPAAALADGPAVVLSNQGLRVNGKSVDCERYNIDGYNYFQLRDLAFVLNGTGSQFSVGYDNANKCVSLVTGEAYEPLGTEMQMSDADKIDTAAPSHDKLTINGEDRGDLSVYKIGGHNYFKLKDLGEALGFSVDYDNPSRTMIVVTKAASQPQPWRIVESNTTSNDGDEEHSILTYDEDGRLLSSWYQYEYYTERYDYFYNELGYKVQVMYDYTSEYDGGTWEEHRDTVFEYDIWGQMVRSVTTSSDTYNDAPVTSEEIYTFDDNGLLLRSESRGSYSPSVMEYTYNERGDVLKTVTTYESGATYTTAYERDEEGRPLRMWGIDGDGETDYSFEYEYEGDLKVRELYVRGDYRSETTYTYDERGNLLRRESETTDWDNFTEYTYDEEDRVVEYVYYDGADMFTCRSTYDEEGRLIREEYENPDDSYVYEYSFNDLGDPLTEVYTGEYYTSFAEYTYDPAESRQTRTVLIKYPPAEEMVISDTEKTLAVGDDDFLYCYFLPYGCMSEDVTWTSSDESVVVMDDEAYSKGYFTAVGVGTAVVTATSESGMTASCTVTVTAEKYVLNLDAEELTLNAGETVPIRCSATCIGEYVSYKLRYVYHNELETVFSMRWGDWDNSEIDLFVTGLEAGVSSLEIQVISGDETKVYTARTVTVTVKDDNTDVKP